MKWQGGKLQKAVLYAQKDTKVNIIIPEGMSRKAGKTTFSLKAGEEVVIE